MLGSALDQIGSGITVDHAGCWLAPEWMMTHSSETYSEVCVGGQDWLGHRLMYVLFIGGHANGYELDHLCNKPRCIRPNHLEPLTAKQNAKRRAIRAKHPDASWWRSDWRAPCSLALLGWAGHFGLPVAPSDAFNDRQGRIVIRR